MSAPAPTEPASTTTAPPPPARRRRPVRDALLHTLYGRIGLVLLGLLLIVSVLGPLLEPHGTNNAVGDPFEAPSTSFPLGLDDGGVDMLSQLIAGARVSLIVGLTAAAVAVLIGGAVGMISGYVGGRTEGILMRITDYFLTLPDVPLMIVAAALFGRNLTNVVIIIAAIYWTSTARMVRAEVKSLRERPHIQRVRSLGASHGRILRHHILPGIAPLLAANVVLMISTAIFAESYVSFLGLGDPNAITWGGLIEAASTSSAVLRGAWWAIIPPGLCITLAVVACSMVGQTIEDALNPRLGAGHLSVRTFGVLPLSRFKEKR
ncbi:ABC transporter permease [Streptomyces sp. NPDC059445]|uniref:ABC transporter permease n=1 Tax=Streptomyces sp. NPDC059445 TaxID=3346832 RepID=UPI0036D157F6